MTDVDYYEILDVRPTASAAEIKAAYYRAVRTAHPDAGGTAGMFRLVTDAYRTLSDPQTRAAYDAGAGRQRTNRPAQHAETSPEPDWGDEVRWDAADADDARDARPSENVREEVHPDTGPPWSERWVQTAAGGAVLRWGGSATAVLFVLLATVLFVLPGWLRPAAAGSDVLGFLLDHRLVLGVIVIGYAVAAIYAYLGLLWAPMTVFHLVVFLLLVLGWPSAYWALADAGERLAFLGILAAWIVYAAAMATMPVWRGARPSLDETA